MLLLCALAVESSAADLRKQACACEVGAKLAGVAPVQIGKGVPQPKKIRNAFPGPRPPAWG